MWNRTLSLRSSWLCSKELVLENKSQLTNSTQSQIPAALFLSTATGTSGLSGDRYLTSSTGSFTLGNSGSLYVGTGLAYSITQTVVIAYDLNNYQEYSG